jgi:serine/threonine protein kinase
VPRAWLDALPSLVVGDRLGQGAFATVYAADDAAHGRVALKVLPADADLSALRASADAIARVPAPGLARVHRFGEHQGRGYLVMERIDGVDLLAWVRPPRPDLDPAKVRPTMGQAFGQPVQEGGISAFLAIERGGLRRLRPALARLADALVALHRAGKVHRDVRPENVLVTREGRVVLVDYDLVVDAGGSQLGIGDAWTDAERVDACTDAERVEAAHDTFCGSPAYMAPDDEITPACDWYAFGVLLFEALTGALPFSGTAHEVVVRKRTICAPSPSFVVDLPDDPDARLLDQLCVKLLRRVARLRPTGEEVLAILRDRAML